MKRFRFIKRSSPWACRRTTTFRPGRDARPYTGAFILFRSRRSAETNRAGLADYNSFGVREFVFPRVGRDERFWLCEDRLTGEAKAVKVVMWATNRRGFPAGS